MRAADAKASGESPPGTTTPGASAAGHTHDKGYDKWTKFDIDAALRSVDEEGGAAHDKVGGYAMAVQIESQFFSPSFEYMLPKTYDTNAKQLTP